MQAKEQFVDRSKQQQRHEPISATARAAMTRRGFLVGSAGLALGAAALASGCGGGGGGGRHSGTYRYLDARGEVGASVTIDRSGNVTFWTLDTGAQITDFGIARLEDARFVYETDDEDIVTFADVSGDLVRGRTERQSNQTVGFNWDALREPRPTRGTPPSAFIGSFEADLVISNVDIVVLLGVSPDGNATFFGYFDDLSVPNDTPFQAYEGFSVSESGGGYNYFLDLYGDRIDLREDETDNAAGPRLLYQFANDERLGRLSGQTFNIPLDPVQTRAVGARSRAKNKLDQADRAAGLNRIAEALRQRAAAGRGAR